MIDQPGTRTQTGELGRRMAKLAGWRNKPRFQIDRRPCGPDHQPQKQKSRSQNLAGAGNLPKKCLLPGGQARNEMMRASEPRPTKKRLAKVAGGQMDEPKKAAGGPAGKAAVQKNYFADDETAGDTRWRAKGKKKAKKRKKQSRGLTAYISGRAD